MDHLDTILVAPEDGYRTVRILTQMTRDECIDLFDGNMSELSRALGISRQAVHKRRKNDYVPLWWTERLAEFFR